MKADDLALTMRSLASQICPECLFPVGLVICFSFLLTSCGQPEELIEEPEEPTANYYRFPYEGGCDSEKGWVRAEVETVSNEDEPSAVPSVKIGFWLLTEKEWLQYEDEASTGTNGKLIADMEICGDLRRTYIFPRVRSYAILNDNKRPTLVQGMGGTPWAASPALVMNVPHFESLFDEPVLADVSPVAPPSVEDIALNGGVMTEPPTPETIEGTSYRSRHTVTFIVTPIPDYYVSAQYPDQKCNYFDLGTDGTEEAVGGLNYAVLWKGEAPDDPDNFKRSALVVFEGIDGNNETWPAHWYQILKDLNPYFDSWIPGDIDQNWGPDNWPNIGNWGPGGINWGTDVWIVEYGWGGADIRSCQIPVAKELLRKIGNYYHRQYGHPIPTTVVGFSMGGIVSRGALAQLDAESGTLPGTTTLVDLGIKGFLTVDSPHQGAEVHLKTSTLLKQIHESNFLHDQGLRNYSSTRTWLKLWNPAANQLLFEKCVKPYKITGKSTFLTDIADCREKTLSWHDDFYGWLEGQGLPDSKGYPTTIPMYAISLGLGRQPFSGDSYWIGQDTLWFIDWNLILDLFTTSVSTRAETPILGTTDETWRGRRNREPGSRIEIKESLDSEPQYVDLGLDFYYEPEIFVADMEVNYNPTFISLISALDGTPEKRENERAYLSYSNSRFDRVWYPIERPICTTIYGDEVPPGCVGGWYHDPMEIIANKEAKGVNDRVGEGQDQAYGWDSPGTDWRISTIVDFVAGATYSLWEYPLLEVPSGGNPGEEWSQSGQWVSKLAPPANITLTPSDHQVTIEWNTVEGLDYEILWESEVGENGTFQDVTSAFIHEELQNGKRYTYQIRAIDRNGNACNAIFRPCYALPKDRQSDLSQEYDVYPIDDTPPDGS